IDLVERIGGVQVIGAEELRLPLDELSAHTLEQRILRVQEPRTRESGGPVSGLMNLRSGNHLRDGLRHVTRESLQHRSHSERALARQDLTLERDVTVDP